MKKLEIPAWIIEGNYQDALPCEHCGAKTNFCVAPGEAGDSCWDYFLKHKKPKENWVDR